MKRTFTLLFASLFLCVGAWAFEPGTNITDLSALTDGGYVCFKNVGRNKFIYENSDQKILNGDAVASLAYVWQVHVEEGGKYSFSSLLDNYISTPLDGQDVYTVAVDNEAKDEFAITAHGEDATKWKLQSTNNPDIYWDGQDARFVGWLGSGKNSQYEIAPVSVTEEEITAYFSEIVETARTAAKAEVERLATEATIYPAATTAVSEIGAVTFTGTTPAECKVAITAINAVVADYKTEAYKALAGKPFTIKTPARSNGYMQMSVSSVVGSAEVTSPANIWQFVYNNGAVNVYNPYAGKYLCEPAANSVNIAVTADQANAGAYDLAVSSTDNDEDGAVLKFTSKGKSVHMSGGSTLVRWDDDGASEWTIAEVTDFSAIVEAYKLSSLATLDSWANLTVVFDAGLVAAAKTAVNAISTTDWATFVAIDAELVKVTDAVAAKMFTFQTTATDDGRNGVWVSANPATGKAIGADNQDYNAIWSLRHAGGTSFYMFNELNQVYMGAPSGNCPLTKEPVAAYSFEIVDAANNIVEMKCNGETMHASTQADNGLLNYDHDEAASRWYINTIDVTNDIKELLATVDADDYAEVPALGQYSKAAYDALVAAQATAKTVEEVEAAVAAFKAGKNSPVFTIDGVIYYAAGMSIYDDNDAAPNFKATNIYDKTMWWVFDQTTTTVGVTEAVPVVNYATGNGFWGAESLKIAETSDAVEGQDDGIFLFYTVGNGTPLHYQSVGSVIVRWDATEANSGSATKFTYVGNTYDLDKLTDAHITALVGLQSAYDAKAYCAEAVIGEGLGQYQGNKDAIVTVLNAGKAILDKSLVEQAAMTVDAINAAATAINEVAALTINLPKEGKYYRFQGACEASLPNYYITGYTNADGGRIKLIAEANDSTVFYYADGKLKAYESGKYIGLSSTHWTFADSTNVDAIKPASAITFAASPRKAGAYTIKSADRYLHYTVYGDHVEVNRCEEDADAEHDWYITEVTVTDKPTGIETITTNAETVIYDLSGRRVAKMEKGIYIVNGKKVIK